MNETLTPEGSPAPEKGVADILGEAFQLYRAHAKPLAPHLRAALRSRRRHQFHGPRRHPGPDAGDRRLGRSSAALAGSLSVYMLGLLGTLVTAFFLYGIIVPLTNGALTIAAADRILGGHAEWREVWMLLFRRLGKLLSAVIPAAIVITLGCLFFVIPGLVLALFFAFVSPVVLIEGLGGRAALERSTTLVRSDWLRVALLLMTFAIVRFVAQLVANIFVAPSAIFVGSLLSDLFTMVMLPIPVLGTVLLYFDVRRKRDDFTNDNLRADLDALKGA